MATLKRKAEAPTGAAADLKKPKKDGSLASFFGDPKSTAAKPSCALSTGEGASAPIASKFNKDKWVATLKPEQKDLLKLEIDTLDPSWLAYLKDDITSSRFLELKRFLQKEIDSGKEIYPPLEDVYSWSRHTPLHTVKAVMLGQDPYHAPNQAHGLCFSVRPPTPAPPSLLNMYKALKKDYPTFSAPPNRGGLLTPWANQGVLMINTCLTVRQGNANSHSNRGWESFTQKVIDTVARVRTRGVVFLAWGNAAQKRCAGVKSEKHIVLKGIHPSPLAQTRGSFTDCGHFKQTNEWLRGRYGIEGEIDWNLVKAIPIAPPIVATPIKVTETKSKTTMQDSSATQLPERKPKAKVDEFEGEDDEDAIEALEELAKSSAHGGGEAEDFDQARKDNGDDEADRK